MSAPIAIGLFIAGALLAIWATERLLAGLVGLAVGLHLAAFAVGAVLSGLEAENIAVGLAAGRTHAAAIALGTVFGGATFLVCVALGLGAVLFPLAVRLPRCILLLFAASPVLSGVSLLARVTPRWSGALLLVAFLGAMSYVVQVSRHQTFLASEEVAEAQALSRSLWLAAGLTIIGLVTISVAGELVAQGAVGIVAALGVPAAVMGMVVTPAAIELEEVFRQAIPAREGRPDVSAGNLIGTLLYFVLCNLGLIALLTPVQVDSRIRWLDWPFLVGVTWVATACLWRGRLGRGAGLLLLVAYGAYAALQVLVR
jgi:cation:H+ antiporter